MGFFDRARGKLKTPFQEGASLKMQSVWGSLPEWKKNRLRRVLKDSDHDGVPDRFDCQPFNARRQEPVMQVDLTEAEDETVDAYKVARGLKSKQEALKSMVGRFEVEVKPKNPTAWGLEKGQKKITFSSRGRREE